MVMNPGPSVALLVCNTVFPIISVLSVVLRFWAKSKLDTFKQLRADEYCILVALAITLALSIAAAWGATHGGIGVKQSDLSHEENVAFLKLVYAGDIITPGALAIVKISVIFFYRRIFTTARFRLWSSVMLGIVVVWFVAFFFCFLLPTWPISKNFDPTEGGQHNFNFGAALLMSIVTNMIIDIAILCLPLPQLRRLQMSRGRKYFIIGIFWLGGFCVLASVVRLYYVTQFTKIYGNEAEAYSNLTANLILWSTIEPNTSVIAACLPTLGPLFSKHIISSAFSRLLHTLRWSSYKRAPVEMDSWERIGSRNGNEQVDPKKENGGNGGRHGTENSEESR